MIEWLQHQSQRRNVPEETSSRGSWMPEKLTRGSLKPPALLRYATWWGPSGNAQSVLSLSCCHHLTQYFTALWTQPTLELSVSPHGIFSGNISRLFIYSPRLRPLPCCGVCVCASVCANTVNAVIQTYQYSFQALQSNSACVVVMSVDVYAGGSGFPLLPWCKIPRLFQGFPLPSRSVSIA